MKKIIFLLLLLPNLGVAHVCDKLNKISGFYASKLFQNAIINNKPLDYLTFRSDCNLECLFRTLNTQNIEYTLSANNVAIFDKTSVATLTIEQVNNPVSGYLTCSSNDKRSYIYNPVWINSQKVIQDLQTEDYNTVSRNITLTGYTNTEYANLIQELSDKSYSSDTEIGFRNYQIKTKNLTTLVKVTGLDTSGGFILIVERKK